MLLMLLLPVGEDENSSSASEGREAADGNLAANGCDGCNGLGGAESCSSVLCVNHLKGKQGQNVDCWGLGTLIQSCLRHSSRDDLDATAGSVWPRPKPRDVCTLQISRRFGTKNGRRRQHQALKPVKPAKSLCEAAISIVLLLVGKGNACAAALDAHHLSETTACPFPVPGLCKTANSQTARIVITACYLMPAGPPALALYLVPRPVTGWKTSVLNENVPSPGPALREESRPSTTHSSHSLNVRPH